MVLGIMYIFPFLQNTFPILENPIIIVAVIIILEQTFHHDRHKMWTLDIRDKSKHPRGIKMHSEKNWVDSPHHHR